MGRMGVRLVAMATAALGLAAFAAGGASAAAEGAKTIAQAPSIKRNTALHGRLYDGAFYSGYSVAFWTAPFVKGDRITIRTKAAPGVTPPCQILFMPGTDDLNVGATTPVLDPASQTRHGSRNGQRWVATRTGTYVLAMTNADILLSGTQECLDSPPAKPFTFRVTVANRGSGAGSGHGGGGRLSGGGASTHVVAQGESLWLIARGLVGEPAGIAEVASRVGRLWRLNAARIGSGDPDLIYPGQQLRLK
jgi:nucleoid-associated protein YgaU